MHFIRNAIIQLNHSLIKSGYPYTSPTLANLLITDIMTQRSAKTSLKFTLMIEHPRPNIGNLSRREAIAARGAERYRREELWAHTVRKVYGALSSISGIPAIENRIVRPSRLPMKPNTREVMGKASQGAVPDSPLGRFLHGVAVASTQLTAAEIVRVLSAESATAQIGVQLPDRTVIPLMHQEEEGEQGKLGGDSLSGDPEKLFDVHVFYPKRK